MYQQEVLFGSMNLLDSVTLFMQEYTQLTQDQMNLLVRCKLDLVGLPICHLWPRCLILQKRNYLEQSKLPRKKWHPLESPRHRT